MTVEELNQLHLRYIDLSNRFKSSWTFHQFLQGLNKLLMDGEFGQSSADFQAVYGLLKEVSENLNANASDRVRSGLDMAERRLQELNRLLLREDSKVAPSILRLFFQRVRNYNDNIVVQLVKFYLYAYRGLEWTRDHNDKIDFLITKVAEEAQGPQGPWVLRSRSQMRQIFESLWELVQGEEPASQEVQEQRRRIGEFRGKMLEVKTFEQLSEPPLIRQYRELKGELGSLFFHPEILMAVVETNIDLRNHIQQMFRREEQQIVAEYHRIFELQREVTADTELDEELSTFHEKVESFEKGLQSESLRLDELARLRQQVRTLIPRLTDLRAGEDPLPAEPEPAGAPAAAAPVAPLAAITAADSEALEAPPAPPAAAAAPPATPPAASEAPEPRREESRDERVLVGAVPKLAGWDEELLARYRRDLISSLEGTGDDSEPKEVIVAPDLFGFRLEEREVLAYRRWASGDLECDRQLEDFVLWAACLRARAAEELEEIRSIMDDTAVTREAPVFVRASLTTRLADLFVRRFDHEMEMALTFGDSDAARELQLLKMRLWAEYSRLWIKVNR